MFVSACRHPTLGGIFFGANLLAGLSALAAARLASRFGLINTMVFTHLPSNILLILVPLMPNLPLAIAVLFLRFSISQMDVPTRQSYVMAVVPPEERSAAAGVTGVARTIGAAISPCHRRLLDRQPRHDRPAVLPCRRSEIDLRPSSVPQFHQGSPAGRDCRFRRITHLGLCVFRRSERETAALVHKLERILVDDPPDQRLGMTTATHRGHELGQGHRIGRAPVGRRRDQ